MGRRKGKQESVLSARERREFLARVIRAAPGEIDETSDLCESVKRTSAGSEVKMMSKLQALRLDAELAGELKGGGPKAEPVDEWQRLFDDIRAGGGTTGLEDEERGA